MRNVSIAFLLLIPFFGISQDLNKASVKKEMTRVANWQIDHFRDSYSRKTPHHIADWTNGALYVGMVKMAQLTEDEKYFNWLKGIGEEQEWKLHKRKYHADDHTIGQMYIELSRYYKAPKMIRPLTKQFRDILYHPSQSSLSWRTPYNQDRWSWCDALFMSPPVWAKMYNITKDERYLEYLMKEYKATTDFLFDKKENLYYRDEGYIGKLDNGTKIFWARGNGWVFGGLPLIMDELDEGSKEYKYFLKIYKKMAKKLVEIQTTDGHWAMSLLGQEFYPKPETSGTAFFTFGIAWGINNGILDKKEYTPVALNGWNSLVNCITEDGMLGYVQPVGAAPGQSWPDKTEVYGTGAFLAAGSEVYKMLHN